MIWLDSLNRQIKKADPNGKYTWGIENDDDGEGLYLVCLYRKASSDMEGEKMVRVNRNLDCYGLSIMERKRFVLQVIEHMESKL